MGDERTGRLDINWREIQKKKLFVLLSFQVENRQKAKKKKPRTFVQGLFFI